MFKEYSFDFYASFVRDVEELRAARRIALAFHRGGDIQAAGQEVEVKAREVVSHYLSLSHRITHGHIVDSTHLISPQLDVIIADTMNTPIIVRNLQGAEYVPYEAVYAIGEVKTTCTKANIEDFIGKIEKTRNLTREPNIVEGRYPTAALPFPIWNPLYSFLLCIDSVGFKPEDFINTVKGLERKLLPNIICLLDQGLIAYLAYSEKDKKWFPAKPFFGIHPEFSEGDETINYFWTQVDFEDESGLHSDEASLGARRLADLMFHLGVHLSLCKLKAGPLSWLSYHTNGTHGVKLKRLP